MSKILEVENLSKEFTFTRGILKRKASSFYAVDHLSFSIEEGETVGLVGESGSGKSTLALLLLRLLEPTEGSIRYFGRELTSFNKKEMLHFRKSAQIIFQNPFSALNGRKRVLDIIGEPLLYHQIVKNEEEKKAIVVDLLQKVGLSKSSHDRYPHAFSGGERQRIAIARAIALNPKFLICDEVISALDLSIQAQILNLLYELKKNLKLTLLFISHDLSTVKRFCEKAIVLYRGEIVEMASTEEIFRSPSHDYTKTLLSSLL